MKSRLQFGVGEQPVPPPEGEVAGGFLALHHPAEVLANGGAYLEPGACERGWWGWRVAGKKTTQWACETNIIIMGKLSLVNYTLNIREL